MGGGDDVVLRAAGLTRRFGGVTALSGTGIELRPGELHGLIGENGAGKSTLVKILTGVLAPDHGTIELDGAPVTFTGAGDARRHGIATVAQELTIFADLSVAENLFPHDAPRRAGLHSRRLVAEKARPVLDELGLGVPVGMRAGDLSLADQQLVEIGRALLQQPRLLILDEPTSALPRDAVQRLDAVLDRLIGRGMAVLYISHFLEEVLRLAHRVTVLRDGHVVVSGAQVGSVDLDGLVAAMLGHEHGKRAFERAGSTVDGGPVVTVSGVSVPEQLTDVSFSVAAGEIVGFAGLPDAGHLAALRILCGRERTRGGRATVNGRPAPKSLRQAVQAGIAVVSDDRKRYGLMLDQPLWQNIGAVRWLGLGRDGWWLRRGRLARTARTQADRLRIRGRPDDIVSTLSGGNQQKVVIAKWLVAGPDMVVLDDPTRGVDVGARAEIHAVIAELADAGKPVLVASTDLAELCELCDRVLVFQRGRLVRELARVELTEQALSVAMNAGFTIPGENP